MKKRTLLFWFSITVLLGCISFLASGSVLLAKSLSIKTELPFGTLVAWIGIIALPTTIYTGFKNVFLPKSKTDQIARTILLCILLLALLWGFVSYGLAHNWSFNFGQKSAFRGSSKAAEYFWNYTYLVVGTSVVFLILYSIWSIAGRSKQSKNKNNLG